MQYNQFNHVAQRQKFILRPAPFVTSENNQIKKQRNSNPVETNHNDQKTNKNKKQWKATIERKIFDVCSNNHNKDLEQILKHKLTVTEYPQLVTNKSRNFINKISRHKKLFKTTRKDQIRQSRCESEMRIMENIQKMSDKKGKVESDQFLNDKISIANRSRSYSTGMNKIEQQEYGQRATYSNMFKSQTTNLNRKKKVKILLKTFQNNGKPKTQDRINMKLMMSLPKKNPILEENKKYNLYQSARELYESIHRAPQQFLQQYLKHKKQRLTPEIKQSTSSQSQQKILLEIREYVEKNYNQDEFCNYYSARLTSQNDFRLKIRKNQKKKKQKQADTTEDRQCIDAWKQINVDNQLQNNFMKSTGLRAHLENQQDEIIEFMNRQKY